MSGLNSIVNATAMVPSSGIAALFNPIASTAVAICATGNSAAGADINSDNADDDKSTDGAANAMGVWTLGMGLLGDSECTLVRRSSFFCCCC
jgi:hypothetical protein